MTGSDRLDATKVPAEELLEPAPLSADEIKLVVQGSQALQEALAEDSSLPTQIEVVIREHTRQEVTPATLRIVYEGLKLYLEDQALEYLLGILSNSDDARYVEQAQIQATPQMWTWLRRLIALYGSAIREAKATSNANPNSWRVVNRRAFFDTVTSTWGVSLEIVKYSGERLVLDEVPGSALFLADAIVDTLNSIPPEVAPDLLAPEDISHFMETCVRLSELFAPGMLADWAEEEDEVPEDPRHN